MMEHGADQGGGGGAPAGEGGTGSGSTGSGSGSPGSASASLERASTALGGDPSSLPTDGAGAGGSGSPTRDATSTGASFGQTRQPVDGTPEHRIEAAVRNAREAVERDLGWVRQLGSADEVREAVGLIQRLRSNPQAFLQQLISEMGLDQQQDEPEELVDPEPDLITEDGRQRAYSHSAVQQLLRNMEERLTRKMQPFQDFADSSASEREQMNIQREANNVASAALDRAGKMPYFNENKALIRQKLAEMNPQYRRSIGSVAAMYEAYNQVLMEKVYPTQRSDIERGVVADFNKKANGGSTTILPGAGAAAGGPKIREGNLDDLAAHMANIESRMTQQR